jgi:hypothetical protein
VRGERTEKHDLFVREERTERFGFFNKCYVNTGGFGYNTGGFLIRGLLADKGDYWRIVCFNYWRILFVTDGILNDSITGEYFALLADYLIRYKITDGYISLSKTKSCCLHYWRNISASNNSMVLY